MTYRLSLLAGVALAAGLFAAAPVSAEMSNGLYFSGGGGLNWLRDADTSRNGVSQTLRFKTGDIEALALGYGLGNGIRLEGELGHRGSSLNGTEGRVTAWTLMGNALYDFDLGWPVTPYIGAGVGGARINADSVRSAAGTTVNDSDTRFAYQGIAGMAYDITSNLKLDLSYRYLATQNPSFKDNTNADISSKYRDHAVLLAFR
jgi:OmpA-OmpF porin, OOP family